MSEVKISSRYDDYEPVARAIDFLVDNFDEQPDLEATAAHVGMSPTHFQRVFKAGPASRQNAFCNIWRRAGRAARLIAGRAVLDASFSAGLSGPSRLHDLF